MPNPRLDNKQIALANDLLGLIRLRLDELSQGDRELRFALNRKVAKELIYDERGKPGESAKTRRGNAPSAETNYPRGARCSTASKPLISILPRTLS
jgi:hypothetical protein